MLTVACMLRTGGEYKPEHVYALRRSVVRFLARPHRFECLTDATMMTGFTMPLRHDWPKWWPKIELLHPGLFSGPVLYLDLDTVLVDDISPLADLAESGAFVMNRDFYHPTRVNSALMCWTGDALSPIYERMLVDPGRIMLSHKRGGDQAFMADCIAAGLIPEPTRWQDALPGAVVSYKVDVRPTGKVPREARICCYHGVPRPWEAPIAA